MHFRVLDLAAERCVWSVPPIDMVPLKLRGEKLVESVIERLFADQRAARLRIHLARDDSYAGRVERFDVQ